MKGLNTIILAGLCMATLNLSSCKKDDPEPEAAPAVQEEETPAPTIITSSYFAKVDGVVFNHSLFACLEYSGSNSISITASANNSFPSMGLFFSNTVAPGTYEFEGSFGNIRGVYNTGQGADDMYAADSNTGTLIITKHDLENNIIEGTFSFEATPVMGSSSTSSYTISEGAFTAQY
jgi:hypothetical protein